MRPARALLLAAALLLPAGCERESAAPTVTAAARAARADQSTAGWNSHELRTLRSLALARLPPPPPSPGNRHADAPLARALGARLFTDTRLSANGRISCASCHQPDRHFSDGLPRARGIATLSRHTPSLLGVAWSPWQFWDGRADSLWAQAAQPLHNAREQGLSAARLLSVLEQHYRGPYEQLFGPLPARLAGADDELRLFSNAGKALEAYERQLRPQPSRFDDYLASLDQHHPGTVLNSSELHGLRLFMGRGQCLRCHFGPLLSNHGFHNTGLASRSDGVPDAGRDTGLALLLADPLNCQGRFHDSQPATCPQLHHVRRHAPEWLGAFKVPSLRGVAATAPYMHDGRFATLEAVVQHYVRAPNPDGDHGHTELRPLTLDAGEQQSLADFLKTL